MASEKSPASHAALQEIQNEKIKRNRLEDERARKVLKEFYNTDYFDTISTKYSPAPFPLPDNPYARAKMLKKMKKARDREKIEMEKRGVKFIQIPTERYGKKNTQPPWDSHVQAGNRKRSAVYVGHQPDLCPLKLVNHFIPWDESTDIPRDPSEKSQGENKCNFWHCKLPQFRGPCPYDDM